MTFRDILSVWRETVAITLALSPALIAFAIFVSFMLWVARYV